MRKHAKSRSSLSAWLAEAKSAEWKSFQEIKDRYRSVDYLSNNRVVFNIGGNKFRLVVLVQFEAGIVLIDRIGTHAEYNCWKLK